jgi:glucokinase
VVDSTATTDHPVTAAVHEGRTGPGGASSRGPDGAVVLAIDIGGTKVAAAVVDGTGTILGRHQVPTPLGDDPETMFAAVSTVADRAQSGTGEQAVVCGVGCGGPMQRGGATVSPLNIPAWRGFPLRRRLADRVGLPVAVDNDAKALALGEGWLGAARGVDDYLAMVVSTGVGGGIVVDGRLVDGTQGNAGHIGHVVVEPDGRLCPCGGRGCLEAEASGMAIEAVTGRPAVEASDMVRRRTGTLVGRAVASVANLLDIELAVVAGSVALGFGPVFFEAAQQEIALRSRIEFARGTRIIPAGLGADGPLLGAAAVGRRARASAGDGR